MRFGSIPLDPLLVKARGVDTIIAVDGSADTDTFWPNATSLRASYARAATLADGYQTLPYFPSAEVFVQQGLNQRPTFFGCNASQSEIDAGMPMILYLPNSPLGEVGGYYTNVSTYTLEYSREDTQSFLNSMWGAQTRGYPQNGAATDDQFKTCLSCGLLERRRQAAGLSRSSACEQCFSRYCYDAAPADGGSMAAAFAAIPNAVYNQDDIMHP
jgi:lysophospholipase